MQQSHKQQQKELQALQEELLILRQRRDDKGDERSRQDRESLVLVTQQATRVEESARQLTEKLVEKVSGPNRLMRGRTTQQHLTCSKMKQ